MRKGVYCQLIPALFFGLTLADNLNASERLYLAQNTKTSVTVEEQEKRVKEDFYSFLEDTINERRQSKIIPMYRVKVFKKMLPIVDEEFKRYDSLDQTARQRIKEDFVKEATNTLEGRVSLKKEELTESITIILDYSFR